MSEIKVKDQEVKYDQKLPLEAYKILVELLKKDDTLFWQQNSILIAINGGLLTLLGAIQPKDSIIIIPLLLVAISFIICLLGVIICFIWLLIANRFMSFYDHWFEQLKYYEKEYLKPIQVFTMADDYFDNKEIKLGEKAFRINRLSRFIRISTAVKCLSLTLGITWFGAAIYFIIKLLNYSKGC